MLSTYLSKEEKISSLIYVTNHELSSDQTIQKKQFEILAILWEYYIKECDYSYIVNTIKTDKKVVYTFDWPDKMTLTELELLLGNFVYRTEQYKKITHYFNECSKERQSIAQQKFAYNFMDYFEEWWTYNVEEFKDMYNSRFFLDQFIAEKDMMRLMY